MFTVSGSSSGISAPVAAWIRATSLSLPSISTAKAKVKSPVGRCGTATRSTTSFSHWGVTTNGAWSLRGARYGSNGMKKRAECAVIVSQSAKPMERPYSMASRRSPPPAVAGSSGTMTIRGFTRMPPVTLLTRISAGWSGGVWAASGLTTLTASSALVSRIVVRGERDWRVGTMRVWRRIMNGPPGRVARQRFRDRDAVLLRSSLSRRAADLVGRTLRPYRFPARASSRSDVEAMERARAAALDHPTGSPA